MYRIKNLSGSKCEILLYSLIDKDNNIGMTAKNLIEKINAHGENLSQIELRINSDGGDVFEALAMYNYLKNHPARVKIFIDGIAASAASIVACAGNITMPKNAMIMIHNPIGYTYGNSEDMREMSALLDKIQDNIAQIYADKTGQPIEKCKELMNKETWFTAEEAKNFGFAYKIIDARNEAKNIMQEKEKEKEKEKEITQEIKAPSEEEITARINAAVLAERERIKNLDALKVSGCESEIYTAKYESLKDAKTIAFELLSGGKFQDLSRKRELDASDLNGISANAPCEDNSSIINAMAKSINAKRGK